MTRLSASQKMIDAFSHIDGKIDRERAESLACERAARSRAAARAKTYAAIDAGDLRLAAASGALDAAHSVMIEILGPTRAKRAILAAMGRRG